MRAVQCLVFVENGVHGHGTVVGHHHFLEKSPQNLPHAVHSLGVVEVSGGKELRKQVGASFNGSCHQLGKETDEGEKGHDVVCRLDFVLIHVNRIAQCLKRVETDAHR